MPGPFENRLDNPAIRRRRKLAEAKTQREKAFSSPPSRTVNDVANPLSVEGASTIAGAYASRGLQKGIGSNIGQALLGPIAGPVAKFLMPENNKPISDMTTRERKAETYNALELTPVVGDAAAIARSMEDINREGYNPRVLARAGTDIGLSIINPVGASRPIKRGLGMIADDFSDLFRKTDDDIDTKFTDPLVEVGLEREGRIADGVANIESFINDSAVTVDDITTVPIGSLQQYLRSGRIPDAGDYLLDSPASGLGKLNPDDVVDVKLGVRTIKQNRQQVLAHFNSERTRKMQSDLARMGVSYDDAKAAARASFDDIDINRNIFNINNEMLIDPDTGTYRTLQYLDPESGQWKSLGDHADHIITADYVGKSIKEIADMDNPSKASKNVAKGLYAWVNSKDNFVGLYGSANMSRGKRPAAEWQQGQPEEFVPTHREALVSAESAFIEHMKKYGVNEKKARSIFANATGM